MSSHPKHRILTPVLVAVAITACSSATDSVIAFKSGPSASIALSSISVQYLPQPQGVVVYDAGLSAGGMIFGRAFSSTGAVRPLVWTSPYAAAPVEIAPAGSIGNSDDPNDNGDIRGNLDGRAGFWARDAAGWRFANVERGVYTAVSVTSINNSRTIVGYGSLNGTWKALWWSDELAQPTQLPHPTVTGTVTNALTHAINNLGDVVGEVTEQRRYGGKVTYYKHAVLWRRGSLGWETSVLKGAGGYTAAVDVNDQGQVVAQASEPVHSGLLWTPSNGVYGDAIVVSTTHGASNIDRCGRVVGTSYTNTPNKRRAYVWENGVSTELPFPPNAIATEASAITTDLTTGQGIIVGAAQPAGTKNVNQSFRPVRWEIPGCP